MQTGLKNSEKVSMIIRDILKITDSLNDIMDQLEDTVEQHEINEDAKKWGMTT